MTPEEAEFIRRLVHGRSGVVIDPSKTYLIESRLAPVLRREGLASLSALIEAIRGSREERLIWATAEALISHETSFFRDRAPFEQFREDILPALMDRRGDQPIRVWSAACANGEEPYSLAMIVDEEGSKLQGARVDLFGSDLSERCLEKAQSGLYTQFEVQRGLPIRLLVRHFGQQGEMWALSSRVRQMVRWRRINLLANLASLGRFDVIFCRNVVSSFDPATRARVLEQLAAALPEDGTLILGLTETVVGITDALTPVSGRRGLYAPNPAFRQAA